MAKSAPDSAAFGSTYTLVFEFFNYSGVSLNSVSMIDSLTDGLTWASNPYTIVGGLEVSYSTAPLGTSDLDLSVGAIPNGTSSFSIDVQVAGAYTGITPHLNQATISNLQSSVASLGDSMISDDPNTATISDSTAVFIYTLAMLQPTSFSLSRLKQDSSSSFSFIHIILESNI